MIFIITNHKLSRPFYLIDMAGIRVSSDMIKSFSGEGDVIAWIKKVELVAKLSKIKDLAAFIPLYLEGNALAVYLEMTDSQQSSTEDIVKTLVEAFSDGPFIAYAKLASCKWTGQPVDVYCTELRRLAGIAGFTGDHLERTVKLSFVNGMPDSISVDLQQVTDIISLPMSEVLVRARVLTASKSYSTEALSVAAVSFKPQPARSSQAEDRREIKPSGVFVFKGKCFKCNGPHMARSCPEKRPLICYNCGEEGHMLKQCKQDRKQGNE